MMTKMEGQKLILLLALVGLILGYPVSASNNDNQWQNAQPNSFVAHNHSPYNPHGDTRYGQSRPNYPSSAESFQLPRQYAQSTQSIFKHPLQEVDENLGIRHNNQ